MIVNLLEIIGKGNPKETAMHLGGWYDFKLKQIRNPRRN